MKPRVWLNILTLIIMVTVNILANALPINGMNTGEISDNIPSLFTPAGYVFAIWGVIYVAMFAFAIFQALPAQRDNPRLEQIGYWFILANIFNTVWIFLWHNLLFGWSLLVIIGLLISLLMVYLRAGIGVQRSTTKERWLLDIPFGIYVGWASVATIANTATVLIVNNWNGFGIAPEIWTAIVLAVATALSVAMTLLRREVAYPLVIIWSFVGIIVAHSDTPTVAIAAGVGAAIALLVLIVSRVRGGKALA